MIESMERSGGTVAQHVIDANVRETQTNSIRQLMAQYDFPRTHASQVSTLCDRLAWHLSTELLLSSEDRHLLCLAGLVHDLGWHFGGSKHHKRSYKLIASAELPGFTSNQIAKLALMARYHRKAEPKLKHKPFAQLDPLDRQAVTHGAALLRLADGLDRGHRSAVQDVDVRVRPSKVMVWADSVLDDIEIELWAANRKKKLLEQVCGRPVSIRQRSRPRAG